MGQPAFEQRLQAAALHRVLAAGIEGLLAATEPPHQAVQKNIARRRLKTNDIPELARCRQRHQAGQPTEMNQDAMLSGLTEEQVVDCRRQWKTLSTNHNI